MNNLSKKHHYLPRHYLRGFTDINNGFYVYDKQEDKIFYTNPDATFFENNLNTVVFPSGKSSSFLEDLYADIENTSWKSFNKIKSSSYGSPIEPLDKMHLFLFLLFLHWRLPNNINYVERLSKEAFPDGDSNVDYLKLTAINGEKVPVEIIDSIKNSSAFKKSFKLMAPFAPFYKDKDWHTKLDNWRFLYTENDSSWFIVGDSPIITRGDNDHDPINCLNEFVFPISGKILLINVPNLTKKSGFSGEFIIDYGIAIIERAQRFVACQNKDFLKALIGNYKLHIQFGKTDTIVSEMFKALE